MLLVDKKERVIDRLRRRLRVTENGCWEWTGALDPNGYGRIGTGERRRAALVHRVSYQLNVGPIPDGLTLDHLCGNRACCNPEHLDPVTQLENNLRTRSDLCRLGHPITGEPTRRVCVTCRNRSRMRPIECDRCGSVVALSNLTRHKRSEACAERASARLDEEARP